MAAKKLTETAAEARARARRIKIRHEQAAIRARLKADKQAEEEHAQTVADAKVIEDALAFANEHEALEQASVARHVASEKEARERMEYTDPLPVYFHPPLAASELSWWRRFCIWVKG